MADESIGLIYRHAGGTPNRRRTYVTLCGRENCKVSSAGTAYFLPVAACPTRLPNDDGMAEESCRLEARCSVCQLPNLSQRGSSALQKPPRFVLCPHLQDQAENHTCASFFKATPSRRPAGRNKPAQDQPSELSALGPGYAGRAAGKTTRTAARRWPRGVQSRHLWQSRSRTSTPVGGRDALNLKPDLISILIGINDIWHHFGSNDGVNSARFEHLYRLLLEDTRG